MLMINKTNAGRRVELVSTGDPYTKLRPGAQGTMVWERHDGFSMTHTINWDDGSRLSLIDDAGDRFKFLD